MYYVTDQPLQASLRALRSLSEFERLDVVAWIFPEAGVGLIPEFLGNVRQSTLMPVTEYEDQTAAMCTVPKPLTENLVEQVIAHESALAKLIDSFALYRPSENNWVAAVIPHERGILILKEGAHADVLLNTGQPISAERPAWW